MPDNPVAAQGNEKEKQGQADERRKQDYLVAPGVDFIGKNAPDPGQGLWGEDGSRLPEGRADGLIHVVVALAVNHDFLGPRLKRGGRAGIPSGSMPESSFPWGSRRDR